jgi:hypothetical protein
MFNTLGRSCCLLLMTLFYGCAAHQSMSVEDRARISSVVISNDVKKADKLFYLGPTGAFGMMFGAVGALATSGSTIDDATALQKFAESNNIKIEDIVTEELAAAIRASGKLSLGDSPANASAIITVNIKQYGFSVPNGFSSHLVPILFVQCAMIDKAGTVIWQGGDKINPLGNPVDGVTTEELKDPKIIEKEWRSGVQAIVKNIVAELPAAPSGAQGTQ